jgi:hypothetical protein
MKSGLASAMPEMGVLDRRASLRRPQLFWVIGPEIGARLDRLRPGREGVVCAAREHIWIGRSPGSRWALARQLAASRVRAMRRRK